MLGLYRATLNFTSYTRLITTINRNDILQSATGLLQILIFWTLLEISTGGNGCLKSLLKILKWLLKLFSWLVFIIMSRKFFSSSVNNNRLLLAAVLSLAGLVIFSVD